jgi:hypothetical protein
MTRLTTSLLGAALVACGGGGGNGGSVISATTDWHANITGIGSFAGLTGTSDVVLASDGQSFTATTELANATPGAVYPWHVHVGACPGGAIIGEEEYPALVIASDGTAIATATITSGLDVAVPYSVNVHLSPDNLPTIIACGTLVHQGGGGGGGGGDDDGGGGY